MKQKIIARLASMIVAVAIAGVLVASCATTRAATASVSGNGSKFTASDVKMIATSVWGTAVQVAKFSPSVEKEGVESVEAAEPYGETAVAWNFSGLKPSAPVQFDMDVNIDCFQSDSMNEFFLIPGKYPAKLATWPKPDWVSKDLAFKWIDSVGRFAGSPFPDATDGWKHIRNTKMKADDKGNFTVIVTFNHYTENPPVVYNYFTNPTVRTIEDANK